MLRPHPTPPLLPPMRAAALSTLVRLRHVPAWQAVRVVGASPSLTSTLTSTACLAAAGPAGAAPATTPPTPPPPHTPVLLEEIVNAFQGMRLGVYLDGTLGAGEFFFFLTG